ncbi:MAG: polysulfide reductase NrfD, partial [FCB group bacterium]|nr:polysulfide reductase NrfD [FCB group bacterium]
ATRMFPRYIVGGAVLSGFAMVMPLAVIARKIFGVADFITDLHFDKMAKIMLVTGSMVGYAYATEFFIAWYGGNQYEIFTFINRAFGPYAWAYWTMVSCNVIIPQLFWFKKIRSSIGALFVLSILVNVGMWFERFVIVVSSLSRDFLPSSWDYYSPTIFDVLTFVGTFGLFFTFFLLFLRFLPMVSMAEVKGVLPAADPHHGHAEHGKDLKNG